MDNSSCSSSSSRTLEITVLSAEELRIDRGSVKKNAFAVVRIDPFNYRVTKIDAQGGSHPSWDEKLVMNLPMHVSFITLEVQCRKSLEDKLVGTATLPVSDFIGGYVPEGHLNFLSYSLRDSRGKRNGIINVSVIVKIPALACTPPLQALKVPRYECSSEQKVGIPIELTENNFAGTVTGIPNRIPVWNPNQI